jgi:hypothetical protein
MLEEKILICLEAGAVGWEGEGEAGKQRRSRGFGAGLSSRHKKGARVVLPPHSSDWLASSPLCFSQIPAVGGHCRLRIRCISV